jgi:tartrate dehydrogenase/decarboxylase/D-malate dehydrogenase
MMLDHLGEAEAGTAILGAIEGYLGSSSAKLTPDLGGTASTQDLGAAIVALI